MSDSISDSGIVVLRGGCDCQLVTYTSTSLPSVMECCHCGTCRRLSGAPFLPFFAFPSSALTFLYKNTPIRLPSESSGNLSTASSECENPWFKRIRSDIAERRFCGECGSPISMRYFCEKETMWITAGTVDEASVKGVLPRISRHIFVGSKSVWWDVPGDGAERSVERGPGFEEVVERWRRENRGGQGRGSEGEEG